MLVSCCCSFQENVHDLVMGFSHKLINFNYIISNQIWGVRYFMYPYMCTPHTETFFHTVNTVNKVNMNPLMTSESLTHAPGGVTFSL